MEIGGHNVKHVYRAMYFVTVFVVAILLFGSRMKEVEVEAVKTVEMKDAGFPVLTIETMGRKMNILHGYNSNLNANVLRDSMTPIGSDKTFTVYMKEDKTVIKKLKYEIRTVNENEMIASNEVSALEETEEGKKITIKITENLNQGQEYAFKMIATTAMGQKLHYYTRIKYYGDECFLDEKVNFITKFHESSMKKKTAETLKSYMESSYNADNTSLAKVTINSEIKLLHFGNLNPEVISDINMTIKEFNIETAAVVLDYYVKADTGSGEELYSVKEFYRIRYTQNRMYLLKFERTMEAVFDMEHISISNGELKLGITNDTECDVTMDENRTKLCFVRDRQLWYYNIAENKAVKVFSFAENHEETRDFVREYYDRHNLRVLNMDSEGNVDFMVYGYMNRGDYEGSVGIVVYRFYAREERTEELAYVPMDTTYEILNQNLNGFCYVNEKGTFFFFMNNTVYAYDIAAKRMDILAENVTKKTFFMVKNGKYIGWQNSTDPRKATELTLFNLNTESKKIITVTDKKCIRILGSNDQNIIYGYANTADVVENKDGTYTVPLYELEIADSEGKVLKTYKEKGVYIVDAVVEDNVIKLDRVVKRQENGKTVYKTTRTDSILNKRSEIDETVKVTKRVTDKGMTEWYLALPKQIVLTEKPTISTAMNTIITENRTVWLEEKETKEKLYYVYALGRMEGAYTSEAEAILKADELMGTVVDSNYHMVWERSGKYLSHSIPGISKISTQSEVNSVGACMAMLLKLEHKNVSAKELTKSSSSIYRTLKKYVEPLQLTGCTLDEVLYYVSSNRPVIAMKDKEHAVLITGYDEGHVTYVDPSVNKTVTTTLAKAEEMFKAGKNMFIAYMK